MMWRAQAKAVTVDDEWLHVELIDRRRIAVPLAYFPRLFRGTPQERRNCELLGEGTLIHWPDIDEDIDVARLFR